MAKTHRVVFIAAAVAIGCYYFWAVHATGEKFDWTREPGGYYNYLGRAFARGQLHLPIEPSPELLALSNPWDSAVGDAYKMQDMALFNRRYYLYHGAAPALLLFAPWRAATGRNLPENFALFLFCFGGFLFSSGALMRILTLAGVKPGAPLLAALILALGTCQGAPYLLNRVWVYEVAIGGGYFCLSAAMFFLLMGVGPRWNNRWLAASGLMFGLSIACRPHLGLAAPVALAALALLGKRKSAVSLASFAAPLILVGAAIGVYNYQRFGDPFEFGVRYLLAGPNQNRIRFAVENVMPGLYFMLACPPDFSPVFPWVRLAFRYPFNSPDFGFPPGYFIEPTAGALWLAPFIPGALFAPAGIRILLWTISAPAAGFLMLLAATGFTTQRYEVDFLPLAALAAVACLGIHITRSRGFARAALSAFLAMAVIFGAGVNFGLAVTGPYDEMLAKRPEAYVRMARWFSPVDEYRPRFKPRVAVDFTADLRPQRDGVRERLVAMGRHSLHAEHAGGRVRLVCGEASKDLGAPGTVEMHVAYAPESERLTVAMNGEEVLTNRIGPLVAAPAEVTVGECVRNARKVVR